MCAILRNDRAPIIEQCRDRKATAILMVQIGKGVSIEGTIWRPVVGPNTISSVKAVWLDSNPKRAVLRLIGMARNVAGEQKLSAI